MNANNKSLSKWLFYSVIIIIVALLASKLKLMDHADDVTFSNALNHSSLFAYLIERYETWSGRVVIEALMVMTISIGAFWKVMIPLCLLSSSYLIWSISLKGRVSSMHGVPLALALLLLINSPILGDSQWWVTGFYNYLLPVTCALFIINVLVISSSSKWKLCLAYAASIIATSSEQTAILLIIVIPFIFFAKMQNRVSRKALAFAYLFIILGSTLTLLSPGSYNRFQAEAYRYMPQIFEMNLFQKAAIGVDRLVENIATGRNIIFLASCASLILFIIKKGQENALSRTCILISTAAVLVILTSNSAYMRELKYITYEGRFFYIDFSNIRVYCCYFFYLLTLICLAVGSVKDNAGELDYRGFVVLMAGVVVTIAIGLSPTAYASGERVLYVFNVCLIIYTLFNIRRVVG